MLSVFLFSIFYYDVTVYIVQLHEVLRQNDQIYLILEYVGGGELYVFHLFHLLLDTFSAYSLYFTLSHLYLAMLEPLSRPHNSRSLFYFSFFPY